MRRYQVVLALTAVLPPILFGCGGDPNDDPSTAGGTGGTTVSQGGVSGDSQGGAGTSTGGESDGGSAGVDEPVELPAQPICESSALACNGVCLNYGESADGCTYVLAVSRVSAMTADESGIYLAGGQLPLSGVHRFDVAGRQLTLLDGDTHAPNTSDMAVVDGTLAYVWRQQGGASGSLRAVPIAGGQPSTLIDNVLEAYALTQTQGQVYFAGIVEGGGTQSKVYQVPLTGGTVTSSDLPAGSIQANQALLAFSFAGNLRTASLADITASQEVVRQQQLPSQIEWPFRGWSIDEEYVYWLRDGTYYRLPLTSVSATEEMGEVVQTLPSLLETYAGIGDEVFLTATIDETTGLYTMPLTGGNPTLLAVLGLVGLEKIERIAADATHVFVAAGGVLLQIDR